MAERKLAGSWMFPGIVVLLIACGPTDRSERPEVGEQSSAAHMADPARIASGPMTPSGAPARIISLAPNLTEIVYHLGEEDRLVGVSRYCKFPPEAQNKPKVGALTDVDYEKLIVLRPDLALLLPSHSEIGRRLERLSIPTLTIRSETIEDIYAGVESVALALGGEKKGREVASRLRSDFSAFAGRLASDPGAAPPRVLFVIGRNPGTLQQIYVCGSDNYLNDLLTSIGAVNVTGETELPWPVLNKETILRMDPDIILDGSLYDEDATTDPARHMAAWDELATLGAVRSGRVVRISDAHLLIPGPGFVGSAENLVRVISDARRN